MPAFSAVCKQCERHFEVPWDGDRTLLPTAATCPFCAHPDGYGGDDLSLVGAFQVECPVCGEAFTPEVPAKYIDYSTPTGLAPNMALTCKYCHTTSNFSPGDVAWLGQGSSMPQGRALGVGQQRA